MDIESQGDHILYAVSSEQPVTPDGVRLVASLRWVFQGTGPLSRARFYLVQRHVVLEARDESDEPIETYRLGHPGSPVTLRLLGHVPQAHSLEESPKRNPVEDFPRDGAVWVQKEKELLRQMDDERRSPKEMAQEIASVLRRSSSAVEKRIKECRKHH